MAAQLQGPHLLGNKTPSNSGSAEDAYLTLHITPLETIESERTPNTPLKDPALKKKSGKLVSKRKLFLQNGQSVQINKAKRYCGPKSATVQSQASRPTEAGPRVNYPLTERQQLQYLLEVTAKEAQQDSGSSSNDDMPTVSNKLKKKDISKDNQMETRIRRRNERGETALHVAAIKGDLEDVVTLIKAGALVDAQDNAGWTPLHEACNYGNLRIVQELVWSGANVNCPGYEAITPLHDAVINDHIKVVKFLLENGADPKLQTSQNYSTAELARSAAVFGLVCPEQSSRDNYAINAQESQVLFQPSQFDDTTFNFQGTKLNGLDGSYSKQESCEPGVHVEAKSNVQPVISYEGSQDHKVCLSPQEAFQTLPGNHCGNQFFHMQNFQNSYDFSKSALHFANDTKFKGSQGKEDLHPSLSSSNIVERIHQRAGLCQQSWNYNVDSTKVECNITENANTSNVTESASENHFQNRTKESATDITSLNSLEESIATETLVRMNASKVFSAKPDVTVTSESEEDTLVPEKLNECLDKAMIEISTYLEASQNFNVQVPSSEGDVSSGRSGLLKKYVSTADDRSFAHNGSPQENQLGCQLRQGDQQSAFSAQNQETELKASESNLCNGNQNHTGTGCGGCQPIGNFTKIKPRNEKKKDVGVERSGRSGRRKRTSTRSSESSKHEINRSLAREECTNHVRNITWRSELPKCRYSLADISFCIPGYEDFLINSRCGSKSFLNEKGNELTNTSQLDKLLSQHDAEKVKLRMTLEQELVRLFGNYARKAAGYQVPYSVCSVIMLQMRSVGMKRVSAPEESPSTIKHDVDKILDKFDRLKAEILKRQNREIEVILALENFWIQSAELTSDRRIAARCSMTSESPPVYSEDFELLPAKFNEYYEDVLCATD